MLSLLYMNAASHVITEGMRVDLQSSGRDDARMFHHCEIKLMLTVYNGLVKASFGKHHDSDPTNSRRPDETYEETLLPLIGQLTSFTLSLVDPETICRDLDSGGQADAAVYHYTDAQRGKPILPMNDVDGFEDGRIIIKGNNLAMQGLMSQLD